MKKIPVLIVMWVMWLSSNVGATELLEAVNTGINTLTITGQPEFDYFFTLVLVFGMISFFLGLFFALTARS